MLVSAGSVSTQATSPWASSASSAARSLNSTTRVVSAIGTGGPTLPTRGAGRAVDQRRDGLVDAAVVAVVEDEDLRPAGDLAADPQDEAVGVGRREAELPVAEAEAAAHLLADRAGVLARQHRRDPVPQPPLGGGDGRRRRVAGHRAGVAEAEVDVGVAVDVDQGVALGVVEDDRVGARPAGHPVHRHAGEQRPLGGVAQLARAGVGVGEAAQLAPHQTRGSSGSWLHLVKLWNNPTHDPRHQPQALIRPGGKDRHRLHRRGRRERDPRPDPRRPAQPGTRLRENEFAERLGIARHSFRAATQILIGEGLLRREPNRGVQVPVFSREDVEDIFRLRAALEVEAMRLVIEAGSVPERGARAVEGALRPLGARPPGAKSSSPTCASTGRSSTPPAASACCAPTRPAVGDRPLHGPARAAYDHPAQVAAEHAELLAAIDAGDLERRRGALAPAPRRRRREPDRRDRAATEAEVAQ